MKSSSTPKPSIDIIRRPLVPNRATAEEIVCSLIAGNLIFSCVFCPPLDRVYKVIFVPAGYLPVGPEGRRTRTFVLQQARDRGWKESSVEAVILARKVFSPEEFLATGTRAFIGMHKPVMVEETERQLVLWPNHFETFRTHTDGAFPQEDGFIFETD